MGRPHHQITFLADPQAQVHLVEGVRQALLIQAADRIEDRLAHHQAVAADGTEIVGDLQAVHVACRVQHLAMERHAGGPLQPENQAGMQHAAIGVEQLGPHHTDFRTLRMIEQFTQPLRLGDHRVGVEHQDILASGLLHGEVAHRRCIAQQLVTQHPDPVAAQLRHAGEPVKRLGALAAIVHQQQLVFTVRGFLQQALDTALQRQGLVLADDNDRHQRPIFMVIVDPIEQCRTALANAVGDTQALQVRLE
ncbi:hypothetical protein D9M71_115360 [compost metagenome]